jgi:putative membrane protein
MSGPQDASPAERTDLAWQRTGIGLLSVGGLLGAKALKSAAPPLLVVAGVALAIGLAVLGLLAPLRRRSLRRDDVAAPRALAGITTAVVLVAVAAALAVVAVPRR